MGIDHEHRERDCTAPQHEGHRRLPFASFYRRTDGQPASWCKVCQKADSRRRWREKRATGVMKGAGPRETRRMALLERLHGGCDCCGTQDFHCIIWPRNAARFIERHGVLCGNCYVAKRQWGTCHAAIRDFGSRRGSTFDKGSKYGDVPNGDGAGHPPAWPETHEREPLPPEALLPGPGVTVEPVSPTLEEPPI